MAVTHDIPMQAILLYASMRWKRYLQGRAGDWIDAAGGFASRQRMIVVTAQ